MKIPNFNSIFVEKNGELKFTSNINYESRNESVIKLIRMTNEIYNFKDFDLTIINTGDHPTGTLYEGSRVLSFSTTTNDYTHTCPDFLFDKWTEVQIGDYETVVENFIQIGKNKPETNLLGWRGALTNSSRHNILKYKDLSKFDVQSIVWKRNDPKKLTCDNYVSLEDHVKKWRFLIDLEGNGWSARTKLFFFSRRVLFLQERAYKEWFYEKLVPWEHYVPVSNNLSNLEENLEKIKQSEKLENEIAENAFQFAMNNLRRKNALDRWNELLGENKL